MIRMTVGRMAVALGATAAVIALAVTMSWSAGTALAADEVACNGDHALESDGLQCTELLNKGTGEPIGEAFTSRSGMTLTIYTNLFAPQTDTGHSEEKLCVDDDADPYSTEESCLGASAGDTISGATLVPNPGLGEEDPGKWEYMIEGVQLTESTGTGSADGLGKYEVFISTYTHASFHFNNGQASIETFFEIPGEPDTPTPTPTATDTSTPTPTETPDNTPTPTNTPSDTPTATNTPAQSTPTRTPGGGGDDDDDTPTATAPASTPTLVSTVLAGEVTPTSTPTPGTTGVVSLPSSGSGPLGLGDNWALLLLSLWLVVLAGGGLALARRNS